MIIMLSSEEGILLLKLARKSITHFIKNKDSLQKPSNIPENLNKKLGVFVTITKNNELKGCIGYPEPILPLIDGIMNSAISAATEDPRFPPLKEEEIESIDIEVTVLSKPKLIEVDNPNEYPEKIAIGKDGLIVEKEFHKGLLLPQVATEHNMSPTTFLSNTCIKAGLNQYSWLEDDLNIYSFQGQVFKE
jgi:uncharacterized protein (TIGR00296 family)